MLASITAVIGAVTGVASLYFGYLQVRVMRQRHAAEPPPPALPAPAEADEPLRVGAHAAELNGYSVFAPAARVHGFAADFMDRRAELRALRSAVRSARSVVSVEGLSGVGKTALAAALCRKLPRRRQLRWVFCREHQDLTLAALATALAYDRGLPASAPFRALLTHPRVEPVQLIDAVIDYLARHRIVLVLDAYHTVGDQGVRDLVGKLARSKVRSTALLTSQRPVRLTRSPLTRTYTLDGLPAVDARAFLRDHGVAGADSVLDEVWRRAGHGNPEAMRIFAGLASRRSASDVLGELPVHTDALMEWIARLFDTLTASQQSVAKLIAFAYEPVRIELLRDIARRPARELERIVQALTSRFIVSDRSAAEGGLEMHDLFRDYVRSLLTPREKAEFGSRIAGHYQRRARDLLLGQREEPSYGLLYLESFPDYIGNTGQHETFVDDLMARLADHALRPKTGSTALVLGSGNGIHDAGLTRHGLRLVDLDIQPEIAALGRTAAARLDGDVAYVVADMTLRLPLRTESVDAVFDIGSSFGYEESDAENAAVFRHAAYALKPGGPFVFEYANGDYWSTLEAERAVDFTTLPNGSIRANYKIVDQAARTSLNAISLQRPDGTVGWFHHFMHYYPLREIERMMRDAGLDPVAVYGSAGGHVPGDPFDPERSTGMVVIAVKQA